MKMTKKKINPTSSLSKPLPKLVKVEWTDAAASVGWTTEYQDEGTHTIHSVGYVIREDDEDILLAADASYHKDEALDTNRRLAIPVKWIKSRKELKL